jgi:hypothetical protein
MKNEVELFFTVHFASPRKGINHTVTDHILFELTQKILSSLYIALPNFAGG